VGLDVHLAARVMAAGHGGQVLLTDAARRLANASVRDLGEH
jgi:class 3 adenylate cyclase